MPLFEIDPNHFVVVGDVQGLLPALAVPLEIPPQEPVLDRVGWAQQAESSRGGLHGNHPLAANLFMPDRQWSRGEFDSPLAVRVLEISGGPLGYEANVSESSRDSFSSRVRQVDEVQVERTEPLVGPHTNTGAAHKYHLDTVGSQRFHYKRGYLGPSQLAEPAAHSGLPVRRGRLRWSVNCSCTFGGRRVRALSSNAFTSSLNA